MHRKVNLTFFAGKAKVKMESSLEQICKVHKMLHTKFQGFLFLGSGENLPRVFTIYGQGGHLGTADCV